MPPKWQSNIKMQDQGPCVQVIFDIQSDATWLMCHDAFKCIFATYFLANVVLCDRNVSLPWVYCNNDSTGFGNDLIWNHLNLLNVNGENIKIYFIDSKASVKLKTILGV